MRHQRKARVKAHDVKLGFRQFDAMRREVFKDDAAAPPSKD